MDIIGMEPPIPEGAALTAAFNTLDFRCKIVRFVPSTTMNLVSS